jgi:8-oxo-dGTP diphosphatase
MSSRRYYTVVPSSYLLFRDGENILLAERKNTGYHDGEYALPAGHIEEGEYALEAAIREAKEETGVDIAPEDLRFVHTMYRKCADHIRADYFFEVIKWSGELSNPEPEKCDHMKWFPMSNLPDSMVSYVRTAIEHYAAGRVYSEFDEPEDKIL